MCAAGADLEWVLNIQSCSVGKFARALIAFNEKYCKIQFTILHQFTILNGYNFDEE